MPGASHSFLKQICTPEGAPTRDWLQARTGALAEPLQTRLAPLLTSLDNRRFFQGYAEASLLDALHTHAPHPWSASDLTLPGPCYTLSSAPLSAPPSAPSTPRAALNLGVLAFLHPTRPAGEAALHQRLVDALQQVQSPLRFTVLIRRWLPPDLQPEPIRRSLELWLAEVEAGRWQGDQAAYEDASISLEFRLTGRKTTGCPLVAVLGPFTSHRLMEKLEPRIVAELDRYGGSPARNQPLLLALVADQPWTINPSALREFLIGRPGAIATGEEGGWIEVGNVSSVCVFQDPIYRFLSGVLFVSRNPLAPSESPASSLQIEAWLNPWAQAPIRPEQLPGRAFAEELPEGAGRRPSGYPRRMRWFPHPA